MSKFLISIVATLALAAVPMTAQAAPCKDAKGKFIKCPPAPAAKAAATPAKPAVAAKPAAPAKATTPAKPSAGAKKAPCRDAKGRFTKCK